MKHLTIGPYKGYPVGLCVQQYKQVIPHFVQHIKKIVLEVEYKGKYHNGVCLWCAGSSGSIIAGMIAQEYEGQLIICHVHDTDTQVARIVAHMKTHDVLPDKLIHIAVDDFVATGRTSQMIKVAAESVGITITHLITNS